MKTTLKLILMMMIFFPFSCNKTEDALNNEFLRGVWVHTETKTDTIDFNIDFSDKTFKLNRGKEVRNGYVLPKIGSDFYTYEVKGDSIYLQAMLSSCFCRYPFYFKLNPDKRSFQIGNFAPFTGGLIMNEFRKVNE